MLDKCNICFFRNTPNKAIMVRINQLKLLRSALTKSSYYDPHEPNQAIRVRIDQLKLLRSAFIWPNQAIMIRIDQIKLLWSTRTK